MTTLKQLLSQPEREQEAMLREAQIGKIESDSKPQIDNTRVTITPEIEDQLPQLKGLGLLGKNVPAAQMMDIRKIGKGMTPGDELKTLSNLLNTEEIKYYSPEIATALRKRVKPLIKEVYGVTVEEEKPKQKPGLKSKDEVKKKWF